MLRLRELSGQVMAVYDELSEQFGSYQREQGLSCIQGCGACCNNPDIEVSVLEMLPYALHLFDIGQAETVLDTLDVATGFSCIMYQRASLDGKQGQCSVYQWRPGICRMFGAAGYKTKTGTATLSVCGVIKAQVPAKYANALIAIGSTKPPMLAEGRSRLAQLDYLLGEKLLPINEALAAALGRVLTLAAYSVGDDTPTPVVAA